jgi:hypothetical protein
MLQLGAIIAHLIGAWNRLAHHIGASVGILRSIRAAQV